MEDKNVVILKSDEVDAAGDIKEKPKMMFAVKWYKIFACVILVILGTVLMPGSLPAQSVESTPPGKKPTVKDISIGTLVNADIFAEELQGRVVMVKLWTRYCPLCTDEIPKFNSLYNKLKQNPAFCMLALENKDTEEKSLRLFVTTHNIDYPVSVGGGISGLQARSMPEYVVFDHEGKQLFRGGFAGARRAVEKALPAAPHPLTGPGPFNKLAMQAALVRKGRNYGKVLAELRDILADPGTDPALAAEGRLMLPRLEAFGRMELARAESLLVREGPVVAAEKFKAVALRFKGDDIAAEAKKRHRQITGDRGYKKEQTAWRLWKVVEEKFKKYGVKSKRENKNMTNMCRQLDGRYHGTAGAGNARELIRIIGGQ
ncbi:TlpA family protein disulfide reductase [Planctomycetota bacterium]